MPLSTYFKAGAGPMPPGNTPAYYSWLRDQQRQEQLAEAAKRFGNPYELGGQHYTNWLERSLQLGEPASLGSASGTGEAFLSSLSFRGVPVTDPGIYSDPFSGGWRKNNAPFLAASFLRGEMGPGGYLSRATQNAAIAAGVHGLIAGGLSRSRALRGALGQSGLASRYALPLARLSEEAAVDEARNFMAGSEAEIAAKRFEANQAFVNMVAQTVAAEKALQGNYEIAKKAAKSSERAGMFSGIGQALGGAVQAAAILA
jgi:hypothetical protein